MHFFSYIIITKIIPPFPYHIFTSSGLRHIFNIPYLTSGLSYNIITFLLRKKIITFSFWYFYHSHIASVLRVVLKYIFKTNPVVIYIPANLFDRDWTFQTQAYIIALFIFKGAIIPLSYFLPPSKKTEYFQRIPSIFENIRYSLSSLYFYSQYSKYFKVNGL